MSWWLGLLVFASGFWVGVTLTAILVASKCDNCRPRPGDEPSETIWKGRK